MKQTTLLLTAISIFAFVSCEEKKAATTDDAAAQSKGPLSELVLKSAPDGAKAISEVRKTAKEGDQIVISGKVMGRKDPFVDGRAILILGDPNKITSCDLIEGDACRSPWDVCCDDPDVIKASTVTIQVMDDQGKLVKQGLKGLAGIKELSKLVVTGTVADGSNADNLLINATGIYVQP